MNFKDKTKEYCMIYIVRHGQSQSNQVEILGQKESKLSEEGKKQAALRAEEFKSIQFDAIFSSKFKRAKETAKLIAKRQNMKKIFVSAALGERNWGKWENDLSEKQRQIFKKLREQYEKLTQQERFKVKLADDMETDEEALNRYKKIIKKIAIKYPGKKILLVSHGNILKILLVNIGFGTWKELPSGSVANTGYAALYTNGEEFIVRKIKGINKVTLS